MVCVCLMVCRVLDYTFAWYSQFAAGTMGLAQAVASCTDEGVSESDTGSVDGGPCVDWCSVLIG